MKTILLALFIFDTAQAGIFLEGEFQKRSGSEDICIEGNFSSRVIAEDKERTISFGPRLSWTLKEEDKGVFVEEVAEGCTYSTEYELKADSLVLKTSRSKCPDKKEEGVLIEEFSLKKDMLQYSKYSPATADKKIICNYKKIK